MPKKGMSKTQFVTGFYFSHLTKHTLYYYNKLLTCIRLSISYRHPLLNTLDYGSCVNEQQLEHLHMRIKFTTVKLAVYIEKVTVQYIINFIFINSSMCSHLYKIGGAVSNFQTDKRHFAFLEKF